MEKNIEIAKIYHECFGASYRILQCYFRYMIKKYKLGFFDHSIFPYCPHHFQYAKHINGILLLSKNAFENNKDSITYQASNCMEIDCLVERFVFKKYNIKLIYNNKLNDPKKRFFGSFKINIILFLKEIFFDLRKMKNDIYFSQSKKISNEETYLILSQIYPNNKYLSPYRLLPNKLMQHFKVNNINSLNMLPNSIGLSFFDKLSNSFIIFFNLTIRLIRNRNISLSTIEFIILFFYRKIYKEKIKRFILKKNIKAIICSFLDLRYEPIYYEASRELKLKYYLYDYSIGYPIGNSIYLRYFPDTRKFGDVIFCNSDFRMEQYKKASSFLKNKNLFRPHTSGQSIYLDNRKLNKIHSFNKYKIGVVDNIFSSDLLINYDDIYTLLRGLKLVDIDLEIIMHSKRGKSIQILRDLNINNYSCNTLKGDFSILKNIDLIISIGWQGAALQAASLFKKPLIFYSKNGYPYRENIFLFNKKKNKAMNQCCDFLWSNEKNFKKNLEELFFNKEYYLKVKDNSSKLLKDIGFCDLDLDYCFNKYFN